MKLTAFVVLSCLFVSVFTTATTIDTLKKISEGEFGRTLLDTIQIELKTSTKADPRPKILLLLQEIRDEAAAAISDLNTDHSAKQAYYEGQEDKLQGQIDDLNEQIDAASTEINAKQQESGALSDTVNDNQAVVDTLEPYLERITQQRNQDQAAFEADDNTRGQIVAVLEKTRDFISNRLDARQAETTQGSFLEKQNVLIQVKETVMSAEFQKMSPGWGQLISFLATKALHKLNDVEDTQAEAGLQSILNLINQIIADTNTLRSSAQQVNENEKDAFEQESTDVSSRIASAQSIIASNNAEIDVIDSRVAELTNTLGSANDLLSDKKAQLYDNGQESNASNDQYSQNLADRNNQLELIDQVIAIVQNDLSNLQKYTEDAIVNSNIQVSDDDN